MHITVNSESLACMEKMIEMGFKGGFTTSMTNLENLLATLSKKDRISKYSQIYFKELE